ncbi:MAG: DUF3267 domain-containing protein [Clostridiaceae bacterium]
MTTLPPGYREIRKIDLMRNKKEALIVNALALGITAAMIVFGFVIGPHKFQITFGLDSLLLFGVMLIGIVFYMILHELVHGAFMQGFSGERPKYGFTGLYAYAGSTALFGRRQYLIIAFAPVVLLGIALAVLNIAFYETAFWVVYLVQVVNVSGAAGDIYVGCVISRANNTVLIRDTGTDMTMFSAR